MGCPVSWVTEKQHFVCPCHQSVYDPAREGYVVQGVAQRPLPRILLEEHDGRIFAVGVQGLVYGYRTNLTPGRRVA